MFEQWLSVAYRQDQEKTASRRMVDQLKRLPMDELRKAASGDPTSKLAYVDGPSDERDSWIGKYKGSPLFSKAVELEKSLLQIDMEENARRAEENAEPKASSDSYERKDAIKLQQRMLDLDLAMEGAGVENPEAKEEEGVQLLEQAQQEEAAAGEGNEPHEKAEDAAIQQFRGAQQQEATVPKTEVKVGSSSHGSAHVMRFYTDPVYRAACEAVREKTAGTLGSDTRRIAPGSNNEVLHGGGTQGNGTLGDYQPTTDDHFSNVSEGLQVNKTASASLASVMEAGRFMAKTAAALTENQREHISKKNFAVPHGGPGGKPAYPVEDPKHARLALSMVSAHGSPSEKSKVHDLVAKKYPALAERSSVPDVRKKTAGLGSMAAGLGTAAKGALGNLKTLGGIATVPGGAKAIGSTALSGAKAFATKNPLATAGIAGGAGLLGGAALGRASKQPLQR